MKYIQGIDRRQMALFPVSLEEAVHEDNEVRLIELFVDSLDLKGFGFKMDHIVNLPSQHAAARPA
jgi:transposase